MSALRSPEPEIEGKYILRRELGRGGVCVVYEAMHRFTERLVALKQPLPAHRRNEEATARLLVEAAALGRVRHHAVVEAFDAGHADGCGYLAMELVEGGRSLEGRLASRGKLGVQVSVNVVRRVADAIAVAHEAGVIHRDIKPGNVLLIRRPSQDDPTKKQTYVKVIDFGLAALARCAVGQSKVTKADTILGTPEYMSLERLTATGDTHPQSDVYALGVTLYECLTGTVPFAGTYPQVLRLVATSDPTPVDRHCPDVPPALVALIEKALAREPEDRHPDARAFCHALDEVMSEMDRSGHAVPPAPPAPLVPRKHPRAPYIGPVRITIDGVTFEGNSEDVSVAGLLVLAPTLLPPGATGDIRFALPGTGEIVSTRVVARWAKENKGHPGARCALGLELLNPDSRVHTAISEYVRLVGPIE